MVHINEPDLRAVRIDHLQHLEGSGYDFSCDGCGYMYRQKPTKCDQCGSNEFVHTREIIRKLELNL